MGNMLTDANKKFTFTYNHLNLIITAVKTGTGAGTITYTYDAAGRKLKQSVTTGQVFCPHA
jgi:YD repeat-containing protein